MDENNTPIPQDDDLDEEETTPEVAPTPEAPNEEGVSTDSGEEGTELEGESM